MTEIGSAIVVVLFFMVVCGTIIGVIGGIYDCVKARRKSRFLNPHGRNDG